MAPTVFETSMNGDAANRQVLCRIARTAFDVVNRHLDRDQWLARELRSDATTSRQVFREEHITVEMAATLLDQFPRHVEITLFTPLEETRTGADWYWRFERGGGAIHARVQAKRVQRSEFGQADEEGHIEIDHRQLDRLIEATREASRQIIGLQAWLATFARSRATPPCGCVDLGECGRHHHQQPCENHDPSVWIAHAEEIMTLGSPRLPVRRVIEHSVRLDCMLPCTDAADAREGPAAKGLVLAAGLPGYKDCIDVIRRNPALRSYFEGALRIFV